MFVFYLIYLHPAQYQCLMYSTVTDGSLPLLRMHLLTPRHTLPIPTGEVMTAANNVALSAKTHLYQLWHDKREKSAAIRERVNGGLWCVL